MSKIQKDFTLPVFKDITQIDRYNSLRVQCITMADKFVNAIGHLEIPAKLPNLDVYIKCEIRKLISRRIFALF